MSLSNSDIDFRLSGGANNGDPTKSIGGAISLVKSGDLIPVSGIMGALWDFVPLSEAQTGLPAEYRCIYAYNKNPNGQSIQNATLWFEALNTDSNITNMIGLDPAGLNGTAQTIPNETTAPTGVVFSQPKKRANGLVLGNMSAGSFYPFWLQRTIAPGSALFYQDYYLLRVEGEPKGTALPPPSPPPGSPPSPGSPPGSPPPPPPPGVTGDFGFAAAGKWSCDAQAQVNITNIINRLSGTPPLQLFLPGGDISYTADPTCWFNMTSRIDHKTHITLGTMENDIELGAQPGILNTWMNHYSLNSQFYSFDFLDVHFMMLSTEIPYDTTTNQYKFAVADLTKASTNSAIDWIVVRCHQPMYSAGGRGDVNGFSNATWASIYGPLFDQYGVDLVIQAHPRNFQRTYPVKFNTTTPSTPIIATGTTGINDYNNPAGTIYIIAGTGGHSLDTSPLTTLPHFAYTNNTDNGYLFVTITNNGTVMKGNFYNIQNNVIDKFSITKS